MGSKQKGLYIKQRDRQLRRLSPRSDNTASTDPQSDEVHVQQYGEGAITPDQTPIWPRKDFEQDEQELVDLTDGPQPSTSTADENFPERAQQYMVRSNSYKELTGAKFITVPEPKSSNRPETVLAVPSTKQAESVRSFSQSARTAAEKMPSNIGHRSVSALTGKQYLMAGSGKHSHLATIRVKPKHYSLKGRMATIKPIPANGTIRSVKGYHLGHNATVRAHNTGHAIRNMKHSVPSWDRPDGTFKRNTYVGERKEYSISQFAIELDNDVETYSPGEFLSGRIILEIQASMEIRFVELLIVGLARVQFGKNDPKNTKDSQEVLLNKRSYVMGTPDGRWNSVITAGKYVSRFKFKLPENLPPTLRYESKEHGFTFEVGYLIKTRICDEIGSSSTRSTHSTNNYVKVLLTRRFPFMVRQIFDLKSIPRALHPVNQSEVVNLNCIPILTDSTITLSIDRSVFLAGDEIRAKLTTSAGTARKIKSLTCDLQQHVMSNIKPRQIFTVVQDYQPDPKGLYYKQNSKTFAMFEFTIPTHSHLLTSFINNVKMIRLNYFIVMTVKFKTCATKLLLQCPIGLGPCVDQTMINHIDGVPLFHRPKRFPYFSKDGKPAAKLQNGNLTTGKKANTDIVL